MKYYSLFLLGWACGAVFMLTLMYEPSPALVQVEVTEDVQNHWGQPKCIGKTVEISHIQEIRQPDGSPAWYTIVKVGVDEPLSIVSKKQPAVGNFIIKDDGTLVPIALLENKPAETPVGQ